MDDLDCVDPLVRAAAYAGLGLPVPRKVRFRFLKRVVARTTWLTNRHQYGYNHDVIEAIELLRRDLAAVAAQTEKHTVADYDRGIATTAASLTTRYATDLAGVEAALRGEHAATLMRLAGQDGEIASAAAVASTATAATLDLRNDVDARFNEFVERFDRLEAAHARAEARSRGAQAQPPAAAGTSPGGGEVLGGLDRVRFADRFRGSPEMITGRLLELVDLVVGAPGPIVDLGAGRGEWLRLMRDKGLTAIGVDDDTASVQMLCDAGLDAVHADALSYLRAAADSSIGVITSFHMVEHLPFATTVALLREAMRVLVPGGRILIETPNITNLHVGAAHFHLDPGHVQPLHPLLLEFALEDIGFVQVDVQVIHPRPTLEVPPAASPQLALVIESLNQAFNVGQDILATAVRPQHA